MHQRVDTASDGRVVPGIARFSKCSLDQQATTCNIAVCAVVWSEKTSHALLRQNGLTVNLPTEGQWRAFKVPRSSRRQRQEVRRLEPLESSY